MNPPYDIQKRTFEFSVQVIQFCRSLRGVHPTTWTLTRQLLKAATSIGANMEEADAAQSKPDFRAKVAIARKEAKESVYWLRLIAATEPLARDGVGPVLREAKQVVSIVAAISRTAETTASRGTTVRTPQR